MSLVVLGWLLLSVIWGTTWLAVRIGLSDLPPMTFAGIRFLTAALLLFGVIRMRRLRLPRASADWALVAQVGLLGIGVAYAAQFWGQQYVPSALASVMFATVPLITLVMAHLRLKSEPLTAAKLSGVLAGIGGVVLIFSDQIHVEGTLVVWASIAFLVGAFAISYTQVSVKARGLHIEPVVLAALQMGVGGTALFAIGLVTEGNPLAITWTVSAVASLAYLSVVGSAIAFFLFYWLLKRLQVTRVTSVMFVHPVVAVFLGWLVLDESLGPRVLFGALVILGGLALVLRQSAPTSSRVDCKAPDVGRISLAREG